MRLNGRRIILWTLLLTLYLISGCAPTVINPAPTMAVKIPARPEIETTPIIMSAGDQTIVIHEIGDWRKIREWFLTLERELKTACLALGNPPKNCQTEE